MTHIDENQEAIACIRMNVDAYDAEGLRLIQKISGKTLGRLNRLYRQQPHGHHRHTGNLVLQGSALLPQVFHLNVKTTLTLEASTRV